MDKQLKKDIRAYIRFIRKELEKAIEESERPTPLKGLCEEGFNIDADQIVKDAKRQQKQWKEQGIK